LPDSWVEIYAEGDQGNLELLIEWCRQGPPSAKVTRVDLDWITPQTMHDFQIR